MKMSAQTILFLVVGAVITVIVTRVLNTQPGGSGPFTGLTNQRGVQGAQGTGLYGTQTGVAESPYS